MSIEPRLEALKNALLLNWRELCSELGISERTLHYLRISARNPSPKLLRRVIELEHNAGIKTTPLPGNLACESGPVYHVDPTRKNENILDAVQEIKRIRDSLDKLERIITGDDDGRK